MFTKQQFLKLLSVLDSQFFKMNSLSFVFNKIFVTDAVDRLVEAFFPTAALAEIEVAFQSAGVGAVLSLAQLRMSLDFYFRAVLESFQLLVELP